MTYLLDTHVWVWWHMSPQRLSREVRAILGAPARYDELLLSAISPWELAKLVDRNRLTLSCDVSVWIEAALDMPKLRLVPLSPEIACASTRLPPEFHDDPADQIIVATARAEGATIMTSDDRIRRYPHVKTL